jgi:hypothetical protein
MAYELTRISQSDEGTFGLLKDENGTQLCVTCEPPKDREHPCIPVGKYSVIPHNSPKHPHTWELLNVPGRTEILIHPGNTIRDTEGCILVGTSFGWLESGQCITESVRAMNKLRDILPDSFEIDIIEELTT